MIFAFSYKLKCGLQPFTDVDLNICAFLSIFGLKLLHRFLFLKLLVRSSCFCLLRGIIAPHHRSWPCLCHSEWKTVCICVFGYTCLHTYIHVKVRTALRNWVLSNMCILAFQLRPLGLQQVTLPGKLCHRPWWDLYNSVDAGMM